MTAIVASGGRNGGLTSARLTASPAEMQRVLAGIPQHGITLGHPSAPVTVTEFADLQCPFCDAYTLTLFPRLVSAYVKPGRVKMVFRNMAFIGPDSVRAGSAAAAAGEQNKLWSYVDAFYFHQGYENSGYVTPLFLKQMAELVPGLDVSKWIADAAAPTMLAELRAVALLAKAERVTATPTFIIERPGRAPTRVVGFTTLKASIDRALKP